MSLFSYTIKQDLPSKFFIFYSILSSKYSSYFSSYNLVFLNDLSNYNWLPLTNYIQRTYVTKKTNILYNLNFYFYFSIDFILLDKNLLYSYTISVSKQLSLLKKKNTLNRWVLFRLGSRGWKDSLFSRSNWIDSTNLQTSLRDSNSKLLKGNFFLSDSHYEFQPTTYKEFNLKSRFNRVFFENRNILRSLFNKKRFTQKRFNSFFYSFLKKDYFDFLLSMEFSLENILYRTRLVFTKKQLQVLITNNLVFLNGFCITNVKKLIKVGDVLQLIVSKDFFLNYRLVFSGMFSFRKFFSAKIWSMTKHLDNVYKQKSNYVSNKFFILLYFYLDIPKFLEVDLSNLLILVIYTPQNLNEFNPVNKFFLNSYLLRLYNWRYIV